MSYKSLSTEERIAPFLALLEARYLPLLLAVAHQAYTMHLWLWHGSDKSYPALFFSIIGALGYESIYVGAIAWTVEGRTSPWTWVTSTAALIFSVAVAVYVYWDMQGYAALLHAGFPIVGFCYTMALHSQQQQAIAEQVAPAIEAPLPASLPKPIKAPAPVQPQEVPISAPIVAPVSALLESLVANIEPAAGIAPKKPQRVTSKRVERPAVSGITKKSRVVAMLNEHGDLKDSELYELLPDISPSSIRVHASEWRNQRKEQVAATNGSH
jgi:hypothetical protein